ncbi:YcjX family protein [Thalassobium sp. R2A62]|uniref:YcjX family protein n=1 Tax=Thalassobium sp. R2A62 TaxID=633131 RepID=UPI0001B1CD59|nr:YcjX family protein [Thalassobium sp. R2A62]EET48353.1 amino acid regulated cytosolic protein [Thalassobium sp. R2A62]
MVIGTLADGITRGIDSVTSTLTSPISDPVIRLGVTGLSRAGKTVFITSLVANLMDRARMPGLIATPRITAAYLQPQPDDTLPRFDFENHLAELTSDTPDWPAGTRTISELRLSLRVQPSGLLAGFQGLRTVHLDIVDYPGEWLLDLSLLDKDFATWSAETLARLDIRAQAEHFKTILAATDASQNLSEPTAQRLAEAFTGYLNTARADGFSDCTPGRFLLPGDLAGSPVLTFAPLPAGDSPRRSLYREFERRYDSYKRNIVKPFFRDHFAKIDRQIVLVDALGAIHAGPPAVEDLRSAMADILSAFRLGKNAFLTSLFRGKRVERILFAATKADHLHHAQHPQLTAIIEGLARDARDRADFAGAKTGAMAIAALRATTEETREHNGETLDLVRGTLTNGKRAAFYPGALPTDPSKLLGPARAGAETWLDADYEVMTFAPAKIDLKPGEGPPHIRLDKAAQFLIGDLL